MSDIPLLPEVEAFLNRSHALFIDGGYVQSHSSQTLEVASPFDYAAQGTLVAAETRADPKDAAHFTAEMVDALMLDLALVDYGALVLFTSREQLRQAVDAL